MTTNSQRGAGVLVIANVVSIILVIIFGGVMVWALVNYNDQKNNVDAKIAAAVEEAKKIQKDDDEKKFAEREKAPNKDFVGPSDLGRIHFLYPKTWSAYIDREAASTFEAYLQPGTVHPVSSNRAYALRVSILDRPYEQELRTYQGLVTKGDLKSSPVTINGFNGNRIEGKFSKDIEGTMVMFKVRDKAFKIFTESPTYKGDFENIILKTLEFNP
jgi:hypothetical protein